MGQSVRDQNCKKSDDKDIYGKQTCIKDGVRQSWEIGGETFASDGKRQTCAPNATNVAPSCWRNTVAADSQNRFRDTDSFTPPQPVRGQALRDCCKLDAGGGSTDLTAVFNKMYEGYDGPGCTNC